MRRLFLAAALGALICGWLGWSWNCARPKPNVVLISIDTLRADHLSCYGYQRRTSPHIDRLAKEGTLFSDAYAASSWTVPSHMTMFTSLPSLVHGVDDVGKYLDPARVTLAERFRDSGYRTAAFVSGPTLNRAFGFDQGFERYEDLSGISDDAYGDDPLLPSSAWDQAHNAVTGPAVSKAVRKWLEGMTGSPFFLFVHLWDPHHEYIPPPPYDTMFDPGTPRSPGPTASPAEAKSSDSKPEPSLEQLIALYDGEIAATDAIVGEIIASLQRLHLLDNTLIALTSDHGEEFYEHWLQGHGSTLFEEVVRVPLIFRLPGRVRAGRRLNAVFDSIHLMPTVLGTVGIESGAEALGRDLSDVLRGAPPPGDLQAFMRISLLRKYPKYALRVGNRKYMTPLDRRPLGFQLLYFDLTKDPKEKSPSFEIDTETVAVKEQFMNVVEWYTKLAEDLPKEGGFQAPLDEKTKEALRALGYVQ